MRNHKYLILFLFAFVIAAPSARAADHYVSHNDCQARVKNAIVRTARLMGLKGKFGVKLFSSPGGVDSRNKSLTKYHAGVFLVKDGYLSDSGADVVVRAKSCEMVKMSISIGG